MTQPKLVIAKRLAELRQDGSDPEVLAKSMSIQKIHHEIEKIREAEPEPEPEPEPEFKPLIHSLFETFFGSNRD